MAVRPLSPPLLRLPLTSHGRTLLFAGGFLGLCALGQLAAAAWALGHRPDKPVAAVAPALAPAPPPLPTPVVSMPAPTPLSAAPTPVPVAETVAAVPTPAASADLAESSLPPPTSPGPAPTSSPPGPPEVTAAGGLGPGGNIGLIRQPTPAPAVPRTAQGPAELIELARTLRGRGDTQSALARLRDAQNASPDNPLVIAEMALTYEGMGLVERASSQWQRLMELGEAAGAPYYLAESRMRGIGPPPAAGNTPPPPAANAGVEDANGGAGRDRGGFQANALLRILEARVEEQPDPDAEKKVALRIIVKNRPGTAIDARKVKVEAYFYDFVDGKDIVQTDAETGYQWLTPPVDWSNDSSEILETTYLRPKGGAPPAAGGSALLPPPPPVSSPRGNNGRRANPRGKTPPPPPPAAADPAPPGPTRVYLGYIVRLYYNRQLQDVRAEPGELLQRFPPVLSLPAEQP